MKRLSGGEKLGIFAAASLMVLMAMGLWVGSVFECQSGVRQANMQSAVVAVAAVRG